MGKAIVRELKERDGQSQLKLTIDSGKLFLEKDNTSLTLDTAQGRWLGNELTSNLNGNSKGELDYDRVFLFAGDVDCGNVKDIQRDMLRAAFKEVHRNTRGPKHLTLLINSVGGNVSEGFALIDTIEFIRGLGVIVLGVVQGVGYSMGAALVQPCTHRTIGRHSRMMLHSTFGLSGGKLDDMKDYVLEMEATNERMAALYAERDPNSEHNIAYWLEFMKEKNRFFSPEECVRIGLVDDIFEPKEYYTLLEKLSD